MSSIQLGCITIIVSSIIQSTSANAKPSKNADWNTKVLVTRPLSVLFVGNSHLLMPGFIKRVRKRIRAKSAQAPRIRVMAKIGATLTKTKRKKGVERVLRSVKWDIIVLQESTTAFMTGHGRKNFLSAVKWFRKRKPAGTKLLLWETWPQGASHALYHRRGVWGRWFKRPPRNPDQLFSWIETGIRRAAKANASYISPIGRCWMSLAPTKRPYAKDDYHPSTRGLTFIAEILAGSVVATAQVNTPSGRVVGSCP